MWLVNAINKTDVNQALLFLFSPVRKRLLFFPFSLSLPLTSSWSLSLALPWLRSSSSSLIYARHHQLWRWLPSLFFVFLTTTFLSLSPLLNSAMADSSFLLSTISFAQMETTRSKGGTWKAMGGRSMRWRLWVEAMRKRRERGWATMVEIPISIVKICFILGG